MAEGMKKKGGGAKGVPDPAQQDRKRLSYVRMRLEELRKEQQTLRQEAEALRAKLGFAPKKADA